MRSVGMCLDDRDVSTLVAVNSFTSAVEAYKKAEVSFGQEVILPHLEMSPVSNQGTLGTCVANAVCDGLELCRAQEGPVEQLSRLSLYSFSRALHGAQNVDKGTYNRCALHQATIVGVLPESKWPYNAAMVNVTPPNKLIILASDNRVEGFYLVEGPGLVDMVKLSLRAHQPLVFSAELDMDDYQNPAPGSILGPPKKISGRHAQLLVGYRVLNDGKTIFRVRNSWGIGWGDGGYTWITEDYLASPHVFDIWAMTRMKELVV